MKTRQFVRNSAVILVAAFAMFAVLALEGHSPGEVLSSAYSSSLASDFRAASTLNRLVLLSLIGLAAAVPFSAGIWNVGGEGQITVGAFAAAIVGLNFDGTPPLLHVSLAIAAGMAAGALWAAIPAVLRLRYNANEIVTTIMMNYIGVLLTEYLANYPFRAAGSASAETERILPSAQLKTLVPLSNLNEGVFVAAAVFLAVTYLMRKSVMGYEWRILGTNDAFAEYGGIRSNRRRFWAMCIGGALAGLVGCILVLGMQRRFIVGIGGGLGFTGALIALIAANSAIVVLGIAVIFALVQSGAVGMEGKLGVPVEVSDVLQSTIILLLIARDAVWRAIERLLVIKRKNPSDVS